MSPDDNPRPARNALQTVIFYVDSFFVDDLKNQSFSTQATRAISALLALVSVSVSASYVFLFRTGPTSDRGMSASFLQIAYMTVFFFMPACGRVWMSMRDETAVRPELIEYLKGRDDMMSLFPIGASISTVYFFFKTMDQLQRFLYSALAVSCVIVVMILMIARIKNPKKYARASYIYELAYMSMIVFWFMEVVKTLAAAR